MSRLALLFTSCLLISVASRADEYVWEVSGAGSSDSGSAVKTGTSSATATHHFGSIDDGNGPYALSIFYDPVTRIFASVGREKRNAESASCHGAPLCASNPLDFTTTDDYRVGGRYVVAGSHWYFGGVYSRGRTDLPASTYPLSKEQKEYGVLVGKYLGPKTSLELTAQSSLDHFESTGLACTFSGCLPSFSAILDTKNDRAALSAQHVRRFRGLTYSLSGRVVQTAGREELDFYPLSSSVPVAPAQPIGGVCCGVVAAPLLDSYSLGRYREYAVDADLFPTAKIGVHIGYSTFDGAASNDYDYDIGASWFITHHVGLRLDFERVQPAFALPRPVDTTNVQVIGRF